MNVCVMCLILQTAPTCFLKQESLLLLRSCRCSQLLFIVGRVTFASNLGLYALLLSLPLSWLVLCWVQLVRRQEQQLSKEQQQLAVTLRLLVASLRSATQLLITQDNSIPKPKPGTPSLRFFWLIGHPLLAARQAGDKQELNAC